MKQRARFESMQKYQPTSATGKAGVAYTNYLLEYWLTPSLWMSWSLAGRHRAAEVLQRPVAGILPTTNHLESFNRVLKRDHIRRLEKAGKRLRIDVLLHALITRIIPAIFETRRLLFDFRIWRHDRFPGQTLQGRPRSKCQDPSLPPLAWIPRTLEATARQQEGKDIAKLGRVHSARWVDAGRTMEALCLSSKSLPIDTDPTTYTLCLQFGGYGWCNCPDYRFRSAQVGICKHLYALLEHLAEWRRIAPRYVLPTFVLPSTQEEALAVHLNQAASHPIRSLTPIPIPTTLPKIAMVLEDMLGIDTAHAKAVSHPTSQLAGESEQEVPTNTLPESPKVSRQDVIYIASTDGSIPLGCRRWD